MKFICKTEDFLNAIVLADNFIVKNSLSVLNCIYLEIIDKKLKIKFTDLKNSGQVTVDIKEGEEGKVLIRTEKLSSIIKKIDSEYIECNLKKEYFCLNNENKNISFKMKISTEDIDKYPILPEVQKEYKIEMKQKELYDLINKVFFVMSKNEVDYMSNGIFFEFKNDKIMSTTTDGKRLSHIIIDKEIKKENEVIISFNILNILRNFLSEGDLKLYIDDRYVLIEFNNYVFYSSVISIKYPEYNKVIMDSVENEIVINKEDFKKAIECVSLISDNESILFLYVSNNKISLNVKNMILGEGNNDIDCVYEGEDRKIIFNYKFLYEPLLVMDSKEVILGFNNVKNPFLYKEKDNDNYINIIVPIKEN